MDPAAASSSACPSLCPDSRICNSTRLDSLDSLRGLAASSVVVYHCWLASGAPALHGFGALFKLGRSAVMVFFVLSAYVLARSLLRMPTTYAAFASKRLFRIYPAFLVTVLASYALHLSLGAPASADSALMERIGAPDLSPAQLTKALALWGTAPSLDLDLVTWSLVHEMRISLIFPLLLLALQRSRIATLGVCTVLSVACTLGLHATAGRMAYGFVEVTFAQTLAVTGYFLVFFAGGAWLALDRERSICALRQVSAPARAVLLVLCAVIFLKGDRGPDDPAVALIDYAHGAASGLLIALIVATPSLSRALSGSALVSLGRISYSLYLVHLPLLYVFGMTLGFDRHPGLTSGAVIVAALLLAALLARGVETPGIRLGRRLLPRSSS